MFATEFKARDRSAVRLVTVCAVSAALALASCTSGVPLSGPASKAGGPTSSPAVSELLPSPDATVAAVSTRPGETASAEAPSLAGSLALEPLPVEVVRWNVVSSSGARAIFVEFFNPNQTLGLVRADFSLAALADDGTVVAVLGEQGIPGSPGTTIYQLPPNGAYGFSELLPDGARDVASVELTIPSPQWRDWREVEPPATQVLDPRLHAGPGSPRVTGGVRVEGGEGVFRLQVIAFIDRGREFVIATAHLATCQEPGITQAFEAESLASFPRGQLTKVVAYTTTVPGFPGSDGRESPPGC